MKRLGSVLQFCTLFLVITILAGCDGTGTRVFVKPEPADPETGTVTRPADNTSTTVARPPSHHAAEGPALRIISPSPGDTADMVAPLRFLLHGSAPDATETVLFVRDGTGL